MGTLRRTCATVPQPLELRFGVVRAVGRAIAVLDEGPRRARGRGCWGFCSPFSHWEMPYWVADSEMFPIRMRKLEISVRQTYRWKARFLGRQSEACNFETAQLIDKRVSYVSSRINALQKGTKLGAITQRGFSATYRDNVVKL